MKKNKNWDSLMVAVVSDKVDNVTLTDQILSAKKHFSNDLSIRIFGKVNSIFRYLGQDLEGDDRFRG